MNFKDIGLFYLAITCSVFLYIVAKTAITPSKTYFDKQREERDKEEDINEL